MSALPNTTIGTVADAVTKVFANISHQDDLRAGARDMLNDASQQATNAREDALVSLAALADTAKWSKYDIEEGVAKAIERRNSKDNSIATFASEIKTACHPSVRGKLPALRQAIVEVWDAEGATLKADKKAPKPLRKAFARRYHMLRECMIQVREGERSFAGPADFYAFAVARDPDLDTKRVFARIKAIRQSLQDFYADFPVAGLRDCDEFLADIGKAELEAARKAKLADTTSEQPAASESATTEGDTTEPAQGVSDLLTEALGDMAA